MASIIGDSLAMAGGSLALLFVFRMKRTYFLDSRFFMGVANVAFDLIIMQNLYSDFSRVPPSEITFIGLIGVTATSIGFASYLLRRNPASPGLSELKAFLSDPPRPFLVYTGVVLCWTICGILMQPWNLDSGTAMGGDFHYKFDLWYLVLSSFLVGSFIGLPVSSVYRQGRSVSDTKTSRSMRTISLSWAGFGLVSFLQVAVEQTQIAGLITESMLFIAIAFALREPTILDRIMSAVSPGGKLVHYQQGGDTVVLYNTQSDRRGLVEAFVREEMDKGRRGAFLVGRAEVPFYRATLKTVSAKKTTDEVAGMQVLVVEDLLRETPKEFSSVLEKIDDEFIDLGDVDASQSRPIIERAKTVADQRLKRRKRIWAIDVENANTEVVSMVQALDPTGKIIDQAAHQDSFAILLGKSHQEILGARLLLEYEPSSSFDNLVKSFVEEFRANVEPVAVFTSVGNPVYKQLHSLPEIRIFSFSAKTSTPRKGSGEEVLLPERDSSLLLDAIDKFLQTYRGQNVGLAFDVFTDFLLLLGFDKAYGVLSSVMEMLESESATALVLINFKAHDERVLSGVRGLFRSRVICDSNGVRVVRFTPAKGRGSEGQPYDIVGAGSQGVTAS